MKQILTKTDALEMVVEAKQTLLSYTKDEVNEAFVYQRLSTDTAFRATMKNVLTYEHYPFLHEGKRDSFWDDFDAAYQAGGFSLSKDDVFQLLNTFCGEEPESSKTYEDAYGMSASRMLSLFGDGGVSAPNAGICVPIGDSKWLFVLVEANAYQNYDDMVGASIAENVEALVKQRAEDLSLAGVPLDFVHDDELLR